VQTPSSADAHLLRLSAGWRNGFDRIHAWGVLDSHTMLQLDGELSAVTRTGGGLILDLRGLTSIDGWGIRTIDRATRRAEQRGAHIFIVSEGSVLITLEAARISHLLSAANASDLFESDGGAWSAVPSASARSEPGDDRTVSGGLRGGAGRGSDPERR
jgi:anti-anti-sigma factor